MREIININKEWKFTKYNEEEAKERYFNDESFEIINIPHTWNVIDGANGEDFYKGECWYRKNFIIDTLNKGRRIFIEFEGSNSVTDVYVNGKYVGQHKGGYSIFRFDITNYVEYGVNNTLSVKVNNTILDDVYPQKADFTFYGGIYRDVNIIVVDDIHFDLEDYGSKGIYIVQEEISNEKALLKIKTKVVNKNSKDIKVRLWADILDAENNHITYVAKEITIEAGSKIETEMPVIIENPILWNGIKNPYMYKAKVSLQSHNDTIDDISIEFGVRYFKVDSQKGFFLNGEHISLKGVSRHQDRKDKGWAINSKEELEDMELIKEIGANSIRLAHYQHNQNFYDLCDKEGMVVWAEIPFISVMSQSDFEGINAKEQMIELIRQNYNHSSIIFWGIQNEIQIGGERSEVRKIVKELNELTKKEDPTRPSTMANVMFIKDTDEYNYITDVVGANRYYGWYTGKVEDFSEWIDGYHKANPQVGLCISEYGAEGIIEYHSSTPKIKDYSEEYHALYHEKAWNIFKERPFLWGTYVWNMFDFSANIRDEGGVKGRNNKGLVTFDRKIKKDAFYIYKAHWSDEKFIHITSKRFIDRSEEKINIKIYSNCNEITLYLNEIDLGTKVSDDKVFVFEDIELKDGINRVKALSNKNREVIEDFAIFNKVIERNKSYEAPIEDDGEEVENWFQMPDFSDVVIEELDISDDVYSTRCTFGEILKNEETKAIFKKFFGNIDENPMFAMTLGMTVDAVSLMARELYTDELMYMFNKELTKIKK